LENGNVPYTQQEAFQGKLLAGNALRKNIITDFLKYIALIKYNNILQVPQINLCTEKEELRGATRNISTTG
jgi:hypothetical protein